MIITAKAYPRAGLIGNPSDGYYGKTIAFVFTNFCAEVVLYQSPELEIIPSTRDHSLFASVRHLVNDVQLHGYYGGIRLLKAAVKCFYDYCVKNRIKLDDRNFTIRYRSNIPHQVGLAGSSAIITACFRALMAFYQISIPKPALANLILSVEQDELGIAAGLQDRVAQVYEGLVYMDFNKKTMKKQGYGYYVYLPMSILPPIYIAYRSDFSEDSEFLHNDLRERYNRNDPAVHKAMSFWTALTDKFKLSLEKNDHRKAAQLINANFDARKKICAISAENIKMVMVARSVGASAKFSGSGGAIVGTYRDKSMYKRLAKALAPLKIKVIRPNIPHNSGENVI